MNGFDQEIVQDFLTESGELLDQLDKDLVLLEQSPRDPDLLNRVFRALHTIKGSASFLQLTNLVNLAHAAESALNAARNGQAVVTREVMDLLLAAVDVLKRQFEDLTQGCPLTKADDALVGSLAAIGEGRAIPTGQSSAPASAPVHAPVPAPIEPAPLVTTSAPVVSGGNDAGAPRAARQEPLVLPDNKLLLVEFLVTDLHETIAKGLDAANLAADPATRSDGLSQIADHFEALLKSAQFFDFAGMSSLCEHVHRAVSSPTAFSDDGARQLLPRVLGALALVKEQATGLASSMLVIRDASGLCDALHRIALDETLDAARVLPSITSAARALVIDNVCASENDVPEVMGLPVFALGSGDQPSKPVEAEPVAFVTPVAPPTPAPSPAPEPASLVQESAAASSAPAAPAPVAAAPVAAPAAAVTTTAGDADAGKAGASVQAAVEQTIRVEVGRLEALLNLVGELVLQKNRLSAIARSAIASSTGTQDFRDHMTLAAGALDRVTGDIQLAVMRTRMQPLDKLFGKYPRLIRDLARKTGKDMRLVIEGGDTEVDKSVIEELGDPLVHMLRNSADHGIEPPADRKAAGKPEQGTITLAARHEGSHVLITIRDDGRGLSRARIGKKAVERGIVSEQELAKMSDRDVYQIIFAAGFSTADKVTDLSGRGVGMDVVRTNIEKIKGAIELDSTEGQGTTLSIKIPLTVAILTAMMVDIGTETYAVPLGSITEIVKPAPGMIASVNSRPVLRLRESVLPLLSGGETFLLPQAKRKDEPFVVIVAVGDKRVGLRVTRLIGQQEVVIKPLDGMVERAGPVSGATVRDDGGVSLIVDVVAMVRSAEQNGGRGPTSESRSRATPQPVLTGV